MRKSVYPPTHLYSLTHVNSLTFPLIHSLTHLLVHSLKHTIYTKQITKKAVNESGLVDEDTANVISSVADAAENQAEAGRDASITDRLKMAG